MELKRRATSVRSTTAGQQTRRRQADRPRLVAHKVLEVDTLFSHSSLVL
jgi:hypothetical protein